MSKTILTAILISAIALYPLSAQTQQAPLTAEQTERILIDAYDAAHVNGLVFITGQQNSVEQNCFGLRFIASGPDGTDESPRKFRLGPHAPDGKFASVSWQPKFAPKTTISLRWHRAGKNTVIGQISASASVGLTMEAYRPFNDTLNSSSWPVFAAQKDNRSILGEKVYNQKQKAPLNRFLLKTDRAALGKFEEAESAFAQRAKLSFDLSANSPVSFVATVGDDFALMEREADKLKSVADLLDKAEKEFAALGAATGGALGDSFETIARSTMWNRLYSAGQRYEYVTPHRISGSGLRGDALGVDSLLLSVLTGLTNGESATASLRILLSGQTTDGRIPMRRYQQTEVVSESPLLAGRSMIPLTALATLKAYLATQDAVFLAWAYPHLQRANDWWHSNRGDNRTWRDGNLDGLLEFGFNAEPEYGVLGAGLLTNTDKQRLAMTEAAQLITATDDSKYHDETHTLDFDSVALNSLYALDTELLAMISKEIGLTTETDRWQLRYDKIKELVNEHLWNEDEKMYLDRNWDGAFTNRRAIDLLLPLVAGIPEPARARLMMDKLRESKELTINAAADQALVTYLLYLGMKRYGFDKEAAELAKQNLKAANTTKSIAELNLKRPTFAPLLALPAIEELLATDVWQGLSFGNTTTTEEARIERVKIAGAIFDVIIGPKRTVIRRDGKIEIEFEAPVKLRGYRSNDRVLVCTVESKSEVRVLIPGEENKKITASVDEKILGSASLGAAASFKIKEGSHKLLVVK